MLAAIAQSSGNKARAHNDNGRLVIVQMHFTEIYAGEWYTIWLIEKEEANHFSAQATGLVATLTWHMVDPNADYWQSV